uniref:B box-type domain-containing protein n=1 Tax=Salmo trutta TaxID=8032 RepID=A0A674A635_SALTR
MACKVSLPIKDFSCPVCWDIFRDPVVMSCCHSFCQTRPQEFWKESGSQECPERNRRASAGSEVFCRLHCEKLMLFCRKDEQAICSVCHDSRKHKGHDCIAIDEAAKDGKMKRRPGELAWKRKRWERVGR